LAARFPGTLIEIEQVVEAVETARGVEAAAEVLRPDPITLPSAARWIRRRLKPVRELLTIIIAMFPDAFLGCAPRVARLRERLGCRGLLGALRELACAHLAALASPLGFRPRGSRLGKPRVGPQQPMGPEPP
jgi:hypothetical protein